MNEPNAPSRYPGPLALAQSLSALALAEASTAAFTREGLRADVEYRDLGLAKATGGRDGREAHSRHQASACPNGMALARHDRAFRLRAARLAHLPLRRRGGRRGGAGRLGLSQPAGVPHNVVGRSDDLEVLEINVPAVFGTWDLAAPPPPWDRA